MTQFNGLNDAVILASKRAQTPRFEVRDVAPQSLKDLFQAYSETSKIIVWSGGSESTIYRAPEVNYAFRAWHDAYHLRLGTEFNLKGETETALAQMSQLGTELQKIIWLEIVGQATHFETTGSFPVNQVEFTINSLKGLKL